MRAASTPRVTVGGFIIFIIIIIIIIIITIITPGVAERQGEVCCIYLFRFGLFLARVGSCDQMYDCSHVPGSEMTPGSSVHRSVTMATALLLIIVHISEANPPERIREDMHTSNETKAAASTKREFMEEGGKEEEEEGEEEEEQE
ncbi:hypothetical protein NQZ68_002421 [Dissostichus eleginoides]|nr:hypothetical protein NQZ68_002421 [Dissostichus eleginoides]